MVALLAAVLAAAAGSAVKKAADVAVNLVEMKFKQWAEFKVDIEEIRENLELIGADLEKQLLQEVTNPSEAQKISLKHMVDLAYDIEDCLDQSQRSPDASCATKVKHLKNRLSKYSPSTMLSEGDHNCNSNTNQSSTMILPQANASSSTHNMGVTSSGSTLVGIDEPMKEILDLLNDIEGQQAEQMTKVICIAGFSGTGKSTLAEEVFKCADLQSRFPCQGRVIASHYKNNPDGLLMELIKQIKPHTRQGRNIVPVQEIRIHLASKRYFILLDDIVDTEQWCSIRSAFPDRGGVIIVTSRDQRVAIACRSHGNGFLYNMRTLNETDSIKYLEASLENKNFSLLWEGSRLFANKCDGHQLSLVSMTKYLLGKENFTREDFCDFWNNLGDSIKSDGVFRELNQILVDSYRTLDSNAVRAFLLYLCLFPNGHPIRKKRLTRRWLADGYSTQLDRPLRQLVEKNVVRTLESSKDATVKSCRVHGIVHGFIVHMSVPAQFIAPAGSVNNNIDRGKYRHLYFEGGESEEPGVGPSVNSPDNNPFRAHSLTIRGTAGKKAIGDLPKCEVLRVLDLEECEDLENDDTKDIHKLWHLKYLSLGATITSLPSKIVELNCLETLDMRKTNIETIPVGIIMLPHLAHLLGKFNKLEKKLTTRWSEVENSLEESNLQTLAGFVTGDKDDHGFARLMVHMKKLNKVKIWCESTDRNSVGFTAISEGIKKFLKTRLSTGQVGQSLSLYLAGSSSEILSSLGNTEDINTEGTVSGHLSTLKLHGALSGHTQFGRLLCGLEELCLSSTNVLTNDDLTNLHMLTLLRYLKLVNVHFVRFEIRKEHFPNLRRLCLVQCHGSVPRIGEEALPCLESLWILDKDLDGLSEIQLEKHKHLKEVALDFSVRQSTITSWDEAAKKHPKRPKVLFFKCESSNGEGSMVKYVARERPEPGTRPETRVESNSVVQLSSNSVPVNFGDANSKEEEAAGRPRVESNYVEQLSSNLVPVNFGDANSKEEEAAGRPRVKSNSVEQLSSNLVPVNFGDANSKEEKAAGRPRVKSNSVEQLSSNLVPINFGDANSKEDVPADRPPPSTKRSAVMKFLRLSCFAAKSDE